MFYRRKIILALLQLFGGELEKIHLQKLLFLFTLSQQKADYDFVPYKYGCFSYSANADLNVMQIKGILSKAEATYKRANKTDYLKTLKDNDRRLLLNVKSIYGKMSKNELIRHTYIDHPYFAINSEIAEQLLTLEELEKVNLARPKATGIVLFTIGYEGISLEEYLNRLLKNDMKVLVDVRNNPLSMKYGFSKGQLKKYCESLGIRYLHFPELGIQSKLRRELDKQSDYDTLFALYRKGTISETRKSQLSILSLLKENKRIALTCFESNICQCHRKHLADAIQMLPGFEYEVRHI